MSRTIQASVTYKAEVTVTVRVPRDWTPEEAIEGLKDAGCYDFDMEDGERLKLHEIKELILNGVEIKL